MKACHYFPQYLFTRAFTHTNTFNRYLFWGVIISCKLAITNLIQIFAVHTISIGMKSHSTTSFSSSSRSFVP